MPRGACIAALALVLLRGCGDAAAGGGMAARPTDPRAPLARGAVARALVEPVARERGVVEVPAEPAAGQAPPASPCEAPAPLQPRIELVQRVEGTSRERGEPVATFHPRLENPTQETFRYSGYRQDMAAYEDEFWSDQGWVAWPVGHRGRGLRTWTLRPGDSVAFEVELFRGLDTRRRCVWLHQGPEGPALQVWSPPLPGTAGARPPAPGPTQEEFFRAYGEAFRAPD